jgi:hypothetical protein
VSFNHNDKQKWYYLVGHRVDEVTMLDIWDSAEDKCEHLWGKKISRAVLMAI